jgi:predicted RNA-binding protein with PUA-like domain
MAYWLLKSEPDDFSIDDLKNIKVEPWNGIRNYQARNFIRKMKPDDKAFFYHSSCKAIGIVGSVRISSDYYEDTLALDSSSPYYDERALIDNPWSAIDVEFESKFESILPLSRLKELAVHDHVLASLDLLKKGNRLSVMPITTEQWQCIFKYAAL